MRGGKRAGLAWLAVALTAGAMLVVLAAWLVPMSVRAARVAPSPLAVYERAGPADPQGFPEVDWEYWTGVNPDVVGWVTVPGTSIDHPVVAAPARDPDHYLTHDVFGNRSVYGCPYLTCESTQGLMGPGAVVMGHHISRGADPVFAPFADYLDEEFARQHPVVLVQTPFQKRVLHVDCALAVNALSEQVRSAEATPAQLSQWRRDLIERSAVRPSEGNGGEGGGFCVFVTCSYTRYSNERTVVVAS